MRLIQFLRKQIGRNVTQNVSIGLQLPPNNPGTNVDSGDVVDVPKSCLGLAEYDTSIDLIMKWDLVQSQLKRICEEFEAKNKATFDGVELSRIPLSEVDVFSPIIRPDKVICIGMNYADHCHEQNVPPPKEPVVFSKFSSAIVGPYDSLRYPDVTEELDWEVELAVVIGKRGKDVKKEDAMKHVFGYTTAHDVSARDWQMKRNGGQWLIGKTMDDFCPLGPALVTKDEIDDPHNLDLQCVVNGVTKQDSNTRQLIFKTEDLIAWLTQFFTLLPGDVILTGTPPGVGVFKKPPEFLKRGDVVECTIEKIGTVRNTVI